MDAQTGVSMPFAEGIGFGEDPRWHDNALRRTLYCVTAATMSLRAARGTRQGRVEQVAAPVTGAGVP